MDIHNSAAQGFAAAADVYVQGRPDYPPETLEWLRDDLGLQSGKAALEVGAGTGKFIAVLRQTGARLLALEPIEAMRERLTAAYGNVEALAGTASSIPLPDGSVDAIICAQAFHWFATDEALAEFKRVLAPGGMLGLVWNVRDLTVPWVVALSEIIAPLEGDTPRYHTGAWRKVFPAEGFSFVSERCAAYVHRGRPQDVIINRILSVSFIAAQPEEVRVKIESQLRALIDQTPDLAGHKDVAFPYETRMFTYRKNG